MLIYLQMGEGKAQDLGGMGLPSPVLRESPAGYPSDMQKEVTEVRWPRGGQRVGDLGDGNCSPGDGDGGGVRVGVG